MLIHSVVSGKKIVMYDGQEIHHSDEMSRAFSHSWYDQEHVLRLDIIDFVEVGAQMAKNRGDKMYELTVSTIIRTGLQRFPHSERSTVCVSSGPQIDGVPFGALHTRPLQLSGRQPSNRGPVRPERTVDLEDDFDPRAVSGGSTLRPKAMVAKSAPVVDLLSMEDAPVSAPALPQPASSFDPFGSMAFDARGGQQDPFFGASVSFPPTANKVIPGNGSTFRGQTVPTMTAEDLAKQLSGVSFAARPQPASGTSSVKSSTIDLSQMNQSSMSTCIISKAPDVDQATASLVNLSNLMDDGPPKHTTAYRPVYTDNRSLEEIKATSKVRYRFSLLGFVPLAGIVATRKLPLSCCSNVSVLDCDSLRNLPSQSS